jgi:hypothetical protein
MMAPPHPITAICSVSPTWLTGLAGRDCGRAGHEPAAHRPRAAGLCYAARGGLGAPFMRSLDHATENTHAKHGRGGGGEKGQQIKKGVGKKKKNSSKEV